MFRTAFRFLARISIIPFGRPVSPVSRLSRFFLAAGHPAGTASRLQRARAALGTIACALALGSALAACSPTFDWRTIMNNDNGYTVDLPAKPGNDQRAVQIDGKPMQMAMQTAEAGDAVFAVGTVMLPNDDAATQRAALEFLRTGLARNVGAAPDAHAVQIPLAAGGQVLGLEMKLTGEAGSQHETRTVYARLVAHGRHVYQAAIIASKPLQQEQVDQFFSSFQLY
ncbi:hypothetical protein R69927_00544 [Paraburkholderia domus]|jgi:hypothetical protein|uniref:hypothetical protein n=1 Tax=Paraburkholderia domus TaxID=2793075 RepID=UPI001B07C663|nr:hypothetical protein [Paraburkholderia domus]CAE6694650.1 hypothetical protein R70006_00524 [Paraburkholderia domus]CAE6766902.1 hypothetical protein R75483_03820 [Paraburkholderia domus]CAE6794286.1 hypothetical protein R69749_02302 [Paraburkholderia domus]CAE6818475.1 hypothetical protein R69927_00544 [Paraburkholderia domus]CAE6883190.1 hypothetical protein R75471_01930 [Paraburkholderia domus]